MNKKGFSLLEMLVALGISSIISLGIFKEMRQAIKKGEIIQELRNIKTLRIKVENLVNPYLNQEGRWFAFDNYKIVKEDQLLNTLPNIASNVNSNLISVLNFDTEFYFIKSIDNENFCLKGSKIKRNFNALVLNKNSWQEATIRLKKDNTCYSIQEIEFYNSPFKLTDKLNKPDKLSNTTKRTVLLPLKDSFSIYLDKNNTLRKLSHHNSYSQPIAYDLEKFDVRYIEEKEVQIELSKKQTITLKNNKTISHLELIAILHNI